MSARVEATPEHEQGRFDVSSKPGNDDQPAYDDIFRGMVAAEADRQTDGEPYVRKRGAVGFWNNICEKDWAAMEASGWRPSWRAFYCAERTALGPNRSHQVPLAAMAARAGVSTKVAKQARTAIKKLGLLGYRRGGRGLPTRVTDPHPRLFEGEEIDPSNTLKGKKSTPLQGNPQRGFGEGCEICGSPTTINKRTGRPWPRCWPCAHPGASAKRNEHQPPPPYDPDRPLTPLEAAYARGEID